MEKPLKTAWVGPKFGWGRGSGITRVGQTVWGRLMESERWCPPSSSVALCGEGSEKEQWPLPALLSVRKMPPSCHPYARQLRSSLYVSDTFQSAALALELIGSETKFVHRSFKRNCLGLQQFFCLPQPLSPLVFTVRSYRDFSSWHWSSRLGVWYVG